MGRRYGIFHQDQNLALKHRNQVSLDKPLTLLGLCVLTHEIDIGLWRKGKWGTPALVSMYTENLRACTWCPWGTRLKTAEMWSIPALSSQEGQQSTGQGRATKARASEDSPHDRNSTGNPHPEHSLGATAWASIGAW